MTGKPSSNMPGSMWTQCESYMNDFPIGTILLVSADYGTLTKELMTVVSESTLNSPDPLYEPLNELHDLWPLLQPF